MHHSERKGRILKLTKAKFVNGPSASLDTWPGYSETISTKNSDAVFSNLPPPKSKKIEKTASEFLVDMVSKYPGEASVLALGPLTNLALVSFSIFPFRSLKQTHAS